MRWLCFKEEEKGDANKKTCFMSACRYVVWLTRKEKRKRKKRIAGLLGSFIDAV